MEGFEAESQQSVDFKGLLATKKTWLNPTTKQKAITFSFKNENDIQYSIDLFYFNEKNVNKFEQIINTFTFQK